MYKSEALREYEEAFLWQCNVYRNRNIETEFEIEVDVYYPNNRSDLDNSLKVILDCLQKCDAIKNDNKCIKIVARKFIDKKSPRVEFTLRELKL
jgi:Holliday junction resolvase RusA-like endonuclease